MQADKSANPPPDDRSVQAAMKRLKQYNAYKTRQMQQAQTDPIPVEDALLDVERWAFDEHDDGLAWARAREARANQRIAEGDYWRDQLRRDEQQAARDAEFRARIDLDEVKSELRSQIEQYEATVRQQAQDGQAWAKKQGTAVATDVKQARRILRSDKLDRALELTAQRAARQRRKRRLVGERMIAQADEARKWKAAAADQPAQYPARQRADVQAALDNIDDWAAQRAESLAPLGAQAEPYQAALAQVQAWTSELKPLVSASGRPLQQAKQSAAANVIESRKLMAAIESFEAELEEEADESLDTFRRWTDRNNALAKHWINSDREAHRKWAAAWLETQEQPG